MFKVKVKADVVKNIIDVTSHLVNEVKLDITPKGVTFRAVDPAHVAMVDGELKKKAFEEYKADEMELGVDLDKLSTIMRMASSETVVTLEYDEGTNRLVITIGNLVRKMGLIDTAGMPTSKIPKLELPAKIVLKKSELNQGLRTSNDVSDHVALTADKKCFELYAEGDVDTVSLKLEKEQLQELKAPEKYKSLFSLDYLSNIVKSANEDITVYLGNDNPIKVEFDFADKNGHVVYLLAPHIESE